MVDQMKAQPDSAQELALGQALEYDNQRWKHGATRRTHGGMWRWQKALHNHLSGHGAN